MRTHIFLGCRTEDEIRQRFRRAALFLHPDAGGAAEAFMDLVADRDEALKLLAQPRPRTTAEEFMDVIREMMAEVERKQARAGRSA